MRPLKPSAFVCCAAAVAALLPLAASAQNVGTFGGRPGAFPVGPQMPPRQVLSPSQPVRGNAPVYGTPVYGNSPVRGNAPVYGSGPVYGLPRPVQGTFGPPASTSRPTYPTFSHQPVGTTYGNVGTGYGNNGNAPVYNYGAGDSTDGRNLRVTTPLGPRHLRGNDYYPVYGGPVGVYGGGYNSGVTVVGGPVLLGGYYYGNYCDTFYGAGTFPSLYNNYYGFPQYIYSPASVIVVTEPYSPIYVTGYTPFYTPSYPVVYNQNIYYVGSQERAEQIVDGDAQTRRAALRTAYPEGSFQAAFGDIERAWTDGNVALLRKHVRGDDVKLSVFFKGKYSYSIAAGDYLQITRDAFDRLSTVSFKFDRLRKAKNGDVTAYGTHVYRVASESAAAPNSDGTTPFSTDGSAQTYDNTSSAAPGVEKTIMVAYTLRREGGQWNIVAVDSSPVDSAR